MNKSITPVVIALILGGIIGYTLKGGPSTPQSPSQKLMKTEKVIRPQSKESKINSATSAAPEKISKDTTVLDWPQKEGGDLVELRKGTTNWTCLPDYPASPGNDPICADKSALEWFQAYMSKKTPQLAQTGIGYMLQGASDASNTDPFATKPAPGEEWVNAPAHIMIFPTGQLDPDVYGTDPKSGGPWIMWAGTPYQHLMVPVK